MKRFLLGIILGISINVFSQTEFQITIGPYLQQVTETEATIVWFTNNDAVSWIELAPDDSTHFYAKERPRYFQTHIGRKVIGTTHTVRLTDLKQGTFYRYRIYSQEVFKENGYLVQYGKTAATKIFKSQPFKFKTLDTQKSAFSFVVVNDIHENNELLSSLLQDVKKENIDFVVYNGDMVNDIRSVDKITNGFLSKSVELFASEVPFYMVRGNHETRGVFADTYMDYFPSKTGLPYYSFQHGNVFFIVLDSGEDKPDSDIEYGGLAAFDAYRIEEQKWLEEQVSSDTYKNAKYRIVIMHMPPMSNHWHGPAMIKDLFVPILNKAKVDLMLSGHLHRHFFYEKDTNGCHFPILINSNKNKVRIDISSDGLNVLTINEQGKKEFGAKLSNQ